MSVAQPTMAMISRTVVKGSIVVEHNGDGGRANPDEAAHFVGGGEEGAAKVMGVVNDDNLLLVVRHEEEIKGLDELHHFNLEACLKIHCAGETGAVAVAGLVHCGDQGKEYFPGGLELHVFYFYKKLRRMAWASTTRDAA